MVFLIDRITVTVVGTVALLILFGARLQLRDTTAERAIVAQEKREVLRLAAVLEQDALNMGYGTPPTESRILHVSTDPSGDVDSLAFWGADATGSRMQIAYGLSDGGTVPVNGEPTPVQVLRRYEYSGGGWVGQGQSAARIDEFVIRFLDAGNNPVPPVEARRVQFRIVHLVPSPPTTRGPLLRRLYWGVTFSPEGLRRYHR